MKDTDKERQRERERAWNRPLSARPRTMSHTGSPGHPLRSGLDHSGSGPSSVSHSREHSRPPSPSESVRSRATEGEENYNRERNWGSPHQKWDHQHRPASPIPGMSHLRAQVQSTLPNGSDTHTHSHTQTGASGTITANPRYILRARHVRLRPLTRFTANRLSLKMGKEIPFIDGNVTGARDNRNGPTQIFTNELHPQILPCLILASGDRPLSQILPPPLLRQL
jgi:hypothetical protein